MNRKKATIKSGRVEQNHLVTQSNKLVEAVYRMSLTAKKLLVCIISKIEPGDEDFKYYMIPVKDFKRLANIKGNTNYFNVLLKAVRELRTRDITISAGNETINIGLASATKKNEKEGIIGIRFDKELMPFLLNIKSEFTRYPLSHVMGMRSVYSIRLYELLKQYENTDKKQRTFKIKDLRDRLGVAPGRYKRYYDFKKNVIKIAEKEIPKHTDIGFYYEEIKEGRAVKLIKFIINIRKKSFIDDGKGIPIDLADIPTAEVPSEIIKWIPEHLKKNHDILRDITKYTTTHGLHYVAQKAAYTNKMKPRDFAAYFGNALSKNLGAEYDPQQLDIFPETQFIKVKDGTKVEYQGNQYTIKDECLWTESGACMPPGRISQLVKQGEIRIIKV